MNTGDMLLKSILANPDEDTPRLVYADWLEENGQAERAEFIRVQCQLARLPECEFPDEGKRCDQTFRPYSISCRACEGRRRERELFDIGTNAGGFLDVFPAWCERCEWKRGFPQHLTMTTTNWLEHADAILAQHPVREVTITNVTHGDPPVVFGTAGVVSEAWLSARWPGITFNLPRLTFIGHSVTTHAG